MQGRVFEDLSVGDSAGMTRTVTDEVIQAFAEVSTDSNPVHLDQAYAEGTMFKGRIAHGMLSGAYVSAVIGMQLPGPGTIYLSQSLRFRRPVRLGDVGEPFRFLLGTFGRSGAPGWSQRSARRRLIFFSSVGCTSASRSRPWIRQGGR